MGIFNYILYYGIILPLSVLPFFVLYAISDFIFFIIYYLVGYRKKVVYQNIRNSFREKSDQECKKIMREFYRHLCDLIMESLKIFTISDRQVQKRMIIRNPEILNPYFDKGRDVILAGGHYNSWELFAVAVDKQLRHDTVALYKPLNNKFFDEKMRATRGKFGLEMVSIKDVKELFERGHDNPLAIIFATDQSPSNPKKGYWMKFLNQETGVLMGTEKYAVKYNCPVFYGTINKVKRGHYEVIMQMVTDDPSSLPHGAITEQHTKLLEADILKAPQYWLWSHRRWKHKKPAL